MNSPFADAKQGYYFVPGRVGSIPGTRRWTNWSKACPEPNLLPHSCCS